MGNGPFFLCRPSSHLRHIRHVLLLFYIYFVLSLYAITLSLHKSICSVCVNSENIGRWYVKKKKGKWPDRQI